MKQHTRDRLALVIGLILLAAGLWQIRAGIGGAVLPYACVGLGCGLFGYGMGNLIRYQLLRGDAELMQQWQIEQGDERNVAIANHAKARAFDTMTFLFSPLLLCLALMQIDLAALLLLVFAYLFVEGYAIYCRIAAEKKM